MSAPRGQALGFAAIISGAALVWGLWRYGATETWELYRLFLGLLVSALVVAWAAPRQPRGVLWVGFLLVGGLLMVQIAVQPTLEGRGYVLAAAGWLALFSSLGFASQGRRSARRLAFFLVALGTLEALYGLTQALPSPPSDGRGADVFGAGAVDARTFGATGTLFNRNHFAGLLNLTLPLGFGALAVRSRRSLASETRALRWVVMLACMLIGLAVLLSLSRGGVLTLIATVLLMASMLFVDRQRAGRGLSPGIAVGLLVLVLAAGLAVGLGGLTSRFANLSEAQNDRPQLYADTLRLVADEPLSGVGPGMYRWQFRPYQTVDAERRFDHAHNDYLEIAADWGLPAALLFWGFVGWRFYRACYHFYAPPAAGESRGSWRRGLALGCAGAVFSILVHSLVDFNLHIPTHLVVFCAVLGLAWSLELAPPRAPLPLATRARRSRRALAAGRS